MISADRTKIENGTIMEICVAAEVVAGGTEEVESLMMMVLTAAVVIMAIKIAMIEVEVAVMMIVVAERGMLVVITTDMMVIVADMADPQLEGMEMDPSAQAVHRGMAYLLPAVVLQCVYYPFLSG